MNKKVFNFQFAQFSRIYSQLCLILGQLVIGSNQSEFPNPVVGQLTKVILHMKPCIQTETIEIFHEPKKNEMNNQQKRESTLKTRCILEAEIQYYGPKQKSIIDCVVFN